MTVIRVVTWNVQGDQQTVFRRTHIHAVLSQLEADIVCVTEAFEENVPKGDLAYILCSQLSDWQPESKGARKVILASRWGWTLTR